MENNKQTNQRKRAPRFGVLDAVILLLIVAVVAGIYFRTHIMDWITNQRNVKEYTVTFAIDNIRYTTPNYLSIGDEVFFSENGDDFGTLIEESDDASNIALNVMPASEWVYIDGVATRVSYPDETRVDVKGRLLCEGSYSDDGGFLVNGTTYIAAGQTISAQTELVSFSLRVLTIEAVE